MSFYWKLDCEVCVFASPMKHGMLTAGTNNLSLLGVLIMSRWGWRMTNNKDASPNCETTSLQRVMADGYRSQYGDETDALFFAMAKDDDKVALVNPFLSKEHRQGIIGSSQAISVLGFTCYRLPKDQKPVMMDGLLSHYFLDFSSVIPALLLPLEPHMRVLDMCAAPGGKLLIMLSRMVKDVRFFANDLSRARSLRLMRVLNEFVPKQYLQSFVTVTTKDATVFGLHEKSRYDAVLLDAPCSSESHVVKDLSLLRKWQGIKKSLPRRQYSLLAAALLACKPKGHVMYATCSINEQENDGVIKRILHKKGDMCALVPLSSSVGDKTECGVIILPNRHGAGPLYFSLLARS